MASLACPVCDLILRVDTPACTALVAKPARRLWPEKPVGSIFAAATRSLTISDTASPDSRSAAMRPCRSTGRKMGPTSIPETASQRSRARTGQWRVRPKGSTHLAPRAFLVGLGAPERDDDPLPHALDVVAVEAHDFRAPEPAREADQEQRPIPHVLHALAHGVQDAEQVLSQQRLGFALGDPARALDAPHRGADDFGPAGIGQPPGLMRLRDCREAADKRGDAERLGVRGEVGGHERRLGGQRAAPGGEMVEVGPVGPARIVGDARLDQGGDLVGNRLCVQLTAEMNAPEPL